jgi:alpha-tubulin suppressor-like RCC1 family protein
LDAAAAGEAESFMRDGGDAKDGIPDLGDGDALSAKPDGGDLDQEFDEEPQPVDPKKTRLAGGHIFACALAGDGTVWCWGAEVGAQWPPPYSSSPLPVEGLSDIVDLDAGPQHVCAVRGDGKVLCFGSEESGELGNGGPEEETGVEPTEVIGLEGAVSLHHLTHRQSCANKMDGTIWCWGLDLDTGQSHPTAVLTEPMSDIVAVSRSKPTSALDEHVCVVRQSGTVWCKGDNLFGQCGPGTPSSPALDFVAVPGIPQAVDVACRDGVSCALTQDGSVWCWGLAPDLCFHQDDGTPKPVPGLSDAVAIAIDEASGWTAPHDCVVRADGTVWCWGAGAEGQLGQNFGFWDCSPLPVQVQSLTDVVEARVSGWANCAAKSSGSVWCWGDNYYGELGMGIGGYEDEERPEPQLVPGLSDVAGVAPGAWHTCAWEKNGAAWCWGGSYSQWWLGLGDTAPVPMPAKVVAFPNASKLTAGNSLTCGLDGTGSLSCWGEAGKLFPGELYSSLPVSIETGSKVLDAAVGLQSYQSQVCASLEDGTGRCYSYWLSAESIAFEGIGEPAAVAMGSSHACFLLKDGSIWCVGEVSCGQLGNGEQWPAAGTLELPSQVEGLPDSLGLDAGLLHTCAVAIDGQVWCWGSNLRGQLGNGAAADGSLLSDLAAADYGYWSYEYGEPTKLCKNWPIEALPVEVVGLSGATQVTTGAFFTCALLDDESVWCWGHNQFGSLGDGTTVDRALPTKVLNLEGVESIQAGLYHVCAVRTDGSLWCWGRAEFNQLGDGSAWNSVPQEVKGLP